jgi:hypothetical protein
MVGCVGGQHIGGMMVKEIGHCVKSFNPKGWGRLAWKSNEHVILLVDRMRCSRAYQFGNTCMGTTYEELHL